MQRFGFAFALLLAGLVPAPGSAQQTGTLHYAGTVGQQQVTLRLEIADDAVRDGGYRYRGQSSEIHFVDSRRFGTTVVLQDEDGNILHLHFETAAGEKAGSFEKAELLEGTLDRGELDLPVKLNRSSPEAAGK